LAADHLALDLKADQQKENCHQRIVDPVQNAKAADMGGENVEISRRERRVGDDKRAQRGRHQHQTAGRLVAEEVAKSAPDSAAIVKGYHEACFAIFVAIARLFSAAKRTCAGKRNNPALWWKDDPSDHSERFLATLFFNRGNASGISDTA